MREIQKNVFLVCCKILAVVFTGRSHLIVCTGMCTYVKTSFIILIEVACCCFSLYWMDRGLQKIAMADDLDVDALLEAPYTKYEVGTTTNHSVSWLLWSCQLFGIQVFSLGLPSWKIFFFLSWFLYDFGSLITVPVRYLFFTYSVMC